MAVGASRVERRLSGIDASNNLSDEEKAPALLTPSIKVEDKSDEIQLPSKTLLLRNLS